MKIFKKIFILSLALGCLSLKGMSEEEGAKIQKRSEICKSPSSLKALCALAISNLIKLGKIERTEFMKLPEGLERYIAFFHATDFFVNDYIAFEKLAEDPELLKVIEETTALFCTLIASQSKYLEDFMKTLDEWFSLSNNKLDYKVTESNEIPELFERIKLILTILIDPNKAVEIQKDPSEIDLDGFIGYEKTDCLLIQELADNAADNSLIHIMNLLLNLNVLSRSFMIKLFEHACSYSNAASYNNIDIFRLLNNRLMLSKEEFKFMLDRNSDVNIFGQAIMENKLDLARYLIELMKALELSSSDIINGMTYDEGRSLLINAVVGQSSPAMIQLLIENGADVGALDKNGHTALFYAQQNYDAFDYDYVYVQDNPKMNQEYREHNLLEIIEIIQLLDPVQAQANKEQVEKACEAVAGNCTIS